jgi:hypothetical protein
MVDWPGHCRDRTPSRRLPDDYSGPQDERADFFQRFGRSVVVPGGGEKNFLFFVALGTEFFAKSPEIKLDRPSAPTSVWVRPFKIF